MTKWGTQGTGDGQFQNPYGIEVDSSGYVYVADSYNYRIQKFSPVSSASQKTTTPKFNFLKSPLVSELKAKQKLSNKETKETNEPLEPKSPKALASWE